MPLKFEKCNDCCIWMKAGVLSYKRCDRKFDCEHCPLDSVLQSDTQPVIQNEQKNGHERISVSISDRLPAEIKNLLAPYTVTYLQSNITHTNGLIWVQQISPRASRIGIHPYILRILPAQRDIVTLAIGSEILLERPVGWVYMGGTTIPLLSPVHGMIIRRNCQQPSAYNSEGKDTYSPSWVAVLHSNEPSDEILWNITYAEAPKQTEHLMNTFVSTVADLFQNTTQLGLCMNDGGTNVLSLEQALGSKTYNELVLNTLKETERTP